MAAAILDLNDHELRLYHGSKIIHRSPGCAIVHPGHLEVGTAACQQAHLQPLLYHDQFWSNLDQTPLRRTSKLARHNADLAYQHLSEVVTNLGKSTRDVVIALPGSYTKEQLALLLGIAQACKITPIALVDAAVGAAASKVGPGSYRHIEMELHRTVITDLRVTDTVERTAVEVIDGAGVDALASRFVAYIADQFLAQSRFDPLHQANTEQLLYDELDGWLSLLTTRRDIKVKIDFRQKPFEARLTSADMVAVGRPVYQEIFSHCAPQDCLLIGSHAARMPGFTNIDSPYLALPDSAVFDGLAEIASSQHKPADGMRLQTSLTARGSEQLSVATSPPPRSIAVATSAQATHLLCGHDAWDVTITPLFLNSDGTVARTRRDSTFAMIESASGVMSINVDDGAVVHIDQVPVSATQTLGLGAEIVLGNNQARFSAIRVTQGDAP